MTSYTNSAVDNILIKLIEEMQRSSEPGGCGQGAAAAAAAGRDASPVDLSFLRLGNAHAVHPSVRPFLPGGSR